MSCRLGLASLVLASLSVTGCNHSTPSVQGASIAAKSSEQSRPLRIIDNKMPRFVTDRTSFDFVRMDQKSKNSHIFEVRNDGPGDLLLRIKHTTCGCTSVKLGDVLWDPHETAPKTIITLTPGDTINVEMNWDTGERMGEFKTAANIETNDPKQPLAVFTVEGEIVPFVQVTQPQVRIDNVRNNAVTNTSTYVYSKKFDDLELTDFSTSNSLINVTFEPAEKLFLESVTALSGVKVKIAVQPGLPIGPFTSSISLKTNKEERQEVVITVLGHVMGDVLMSPSESLEFGIVKVTTGDTKILFLKFVNDSPISVNVGKVALYRAEMATEGPGTPVEPSFLEVTLTPFESAKNRWQLKAQVPAGSPGGKFRGIIELETTHPTAKLVKIPVRFEVTK